MKNRIKNILTITLLVLSTACNDFLERGPIDEIGEVDFYTNTDEINQAVIACYNGIQSTIDLEFYLAEIRSDNARANGMGSTATSSFEIYNPDKFVVETTHSPNTKYFEAVYHNISRCNTVLQYLDVVSDETLKKQFRGEVLFIRAYHYFNLVRLYGPVFEVTEKISFDDAKKKERVSVDQIYALIEADLNSAATDLLPPQYRDADKGRIDSWGAKTLLAKVYLTRHKYQEAKTLLTDVKTNSGYGLITGTDAYAKVFDVNNEMNKEIIFAIRFKSGGFGLGSPFANYFAPSSSYSAVITGGGDGRNTPTDDLIATFDVAGDNVRKNITLSPVWINEQGTTVHVAYVKKFLSSVATKYDAENDWPVLRFADVLLMLGEVENTLSGPDAGLPYLNETRTRAGLTSLTSADVPSSLHFMLAMEKERRLEFAFENHRIFDLLRTNRLVDVMKNHFLTEKYRDQNTGAESLFYQNANYPQVHIPNPVLEEWQFLLPIPFKIMEQTPRAAQNPGY